MGYRDFEVEQAAAAEDRAARRAERQDDWIIDRYAELVRWLEQPMSKVVTPDYAMGRELVPISVEFLAWVLAVHESPDWTLAEALHQPEVMRRLQRRWATARAEMEAAKQPDSMWEAA